MLAEANTKLEIQPPSFHHRTVHSPMPPTLSKWPFFLGNVLLLALGALFFFQSRGPMGPWEMLACTLCIAVGAACAALPFVLEYRVRVKLSVADRLAAVTSQIQNLETLGAQISGATSQWQSVHESAGKIAGSAKAIADRMSAEIREFSQFLRESNDGEKSTLKLEVAKLRRAEEDWLQALVRMLDHIYALQQAAIRSRQPALIEQLGQFQNACRDAARWVGLTPFTAAPQEAFDPQRHKLADGDGSPGSGATIEETLATGYTFQGRLLRPALVRLGKGKGVELQKVAETAA
ncbi:MAG TPA: nucleotide exchange factor GrpE [Verrucomicrobiae bacterium]|nr:nucleotide exchange factor GrpE [Verrucomicrobiae bacterium]